MSLHLLSKRPNLLFLYETINRISPEFAGDWRVSLINSSDTEIIEVKLKGPNGAQHREQLLSKEADDKRLQQSLFRLRDLCTGQVA